MRTASLQSLMATTAELVNIADFMSMQGSLIQLGPDSSPARLMRGLLCLRKRRKTTPEAAGLLEDQRP